MKQLFIVLASLVSIQCSAQFIKYDSTQSVPDGSMLPVNDTVYIDKVTISSLDARMKEDRVRNPQLRLQVIVSSSYGCGGNVYAMEYVTKMCSRFSDSIQVYYILGDFEKDKKEYRGATKHLPQTVRLYSAAERYRDPDDQRAGPDTLTKQLFPESANDVIGTPKFLIWDVQKKKLVFHGFRGYQNTYPEDVVGYFMDENRRYRKRR